MGTYIVLSRLDSDAVRDGQSFRKSAETVASRIKAECPGVKWKKSYATMGRIDVIDIVEADDPAEVEKAALIIRSAGHARTECLHATPWKDFLAGL